MVNINDVAAKEKGKKKEDGDGDRNKLNLKVEVNPELQAEEVDPTAKEFSLLDWMERFNWDYPPSPQEPKPCQEMTEDKK